MRSKRRQGDRLELALAALASALNENHLPWMVIGGIAVIARGVRRLTTDIDAAVRGDAIDATSLLRVLARKRIVPRIPDADQFARESLVLLLRHATTEVDFDVSLAWTEFEQEAIEHASTASFGSVKAPMARPEDLVVFKAIAGRPKDLEDTTALLVLYPSIDRARVRERVKQLARLADEPELGVGLETAIATAATATKRIARPKPKPKPRASRTTSSRASRARSKKAR